MEKLGLKNLSEFYTVPVSEIRKMGGKGLIDGVYKGSLLKALPFVFPDHEWLPWKLDHNMPRSFWDSVENQRRFMDNLAKELGFTRMDQWYRVTEKMIRSRGGKAILAKYGNSPSRLLQAVYPEKAWKLWQFDFVQRDYWDSKENHREFVAGLATKMDIKAMEDWYSVRKEDWKRHGGSGILAKYENSHCRAIQALHPEHEWHMWRFFRAPRMFWHSADNQRKFMGWLEESLGFQSKEDWYKIQVKDIESRGGKQLVERYGSVLELVRSVYPEHDWQIKRFRRTAL